jgi:hypothetical protein
LGTIFEELVRRFNEENNEEAGDHWTPRDAVKLMANLMFIPIADKIESGTYLLYDGALGTGGMLTVIDATGWYRPLRRNLGKKNCELSEEDIDRILKIFLEFRDTEESKIFDNRAFGYWKVTVERPLRIAGLDSERAYTPKEIKALKEEHAVDANALPVIRKIHKIDKPDPLHGLFEIMIKGKRCVVEYEPDADLSDTEQVPLVEAGGIETFIKREVLPHASDAWVGSDATKIGYEISFNRHFYKPPPLRALDQIRADIIALEKETEGLLTRCGRLSRYRALAVRQRRQSCHPIHGTGCRERWQRQ